MELHSLLLRQLERTNLSDKTAPDITEWQAFLQTVSKTYEGIDRDRYLLERSLAISSREMQEEINRRIHAEQEAIDLGIERERKNLITQFVQNISHELRTPVSIILTSTYLLKASTSDLEQLTRIIRVEEQTKVINSLFDILVLMSKLDSGIDLQLKKIYVDSMLRTIIDSLSETVAAKTISLVPDLSADVRFMGDEEKLSLAISEIVKNSISFTPEEGIISVRTGIEPDYISIQIIDSGIGISEEHLERIFERFYRVDDSRSTRGWGLGLSIAKMIIEAHDGFVDIVSQPGAGTEVSINLPLV